MRNIHLEKRHFELIAEALRRSRPHAERGVALAQWRRTVSEVMDALLGTNRAFNRWRFKTWVNY